MFHLELILDLFVAVHKNKTLEGGKTVPLRRGRTVKTVLIRVLEFVEVTLGNTGLFLNAPERQGTDPGNKRNHD